MITESFNPNGSYINFPFDDIKKDLELEFGKYQDMNTLIVFEYNQDVHISFSSVGYLMIIHAAENPLKQNEVIKIVEDFERIVQRYIGRFKFNLPKDLLESKLYRVMEKYGKLIGEVDKPAFSDRQFLIEFLEVVGHDN